MTHDVGSFNALVVNIYVCVQVNADTFFTNTSQPTLSLKLSQEQLNRCYYNVTFIKKNLTFMLLLF